MLENCNNRTFENLAQRSAYAFLATTPDFYPVQPEDAAPEAQRAAHGFIRGIYEGLYEQPKRWGLKTDPDDAFEDWEFQREKPTLAPVIRANMKKIEEGMALLWQISLQGEGTGNVLRFSKSEIPLKPGQIKVLTTVGITVEKTGEDFICTFPIPVSGLKLLARTSAAAPVKEEAPKPYLLFSRGIFNVNAPWSQDVFGRLSGNPEGFKRLVRFLEQEGYRRIDNKTYSNQISLDYIKDYGRADEPLKFAWSERTRGGIEVLYEETRKRPWLISLRVPFYKEILQDSGKMPTEVKAFVMKTGKTCDGCRYCVQTDKTGKKPLAFVQVDGHSKCPMFPGFQYRWRALDAETVEGMIHMLQFVDATRPAQ